MRITYDRGADALAIHLADGRSVRTEHIARMVNADFDAEGRLLSIEVLAASDQYPVAELEQLDPGAVLLTLAQAADEEDLDPEELRRDLVDGILVGHKRGGRWWLARHDLWTYLEAKGYSRRHLI